MREQIVGQLSSSDIDDTDDTSVRPFLSIVIPAFNESSRIIPTLESIASYLHEQVYSWEVLVVDDGSSDGTADLVDEWSRARCNVRVIRREHFGKGWAVKAGMLEAAGRNRFMCDADLAMPIDYLDMFLARMGDGVDIVVGSREAEGSRRFDEPAYRHLMGRLFNWVVRLIAVSSIQDTQCGFKCFRDHAAMKLFSRQRTRGMGFDVELLYVAQKMGLEIEELPIYWYHHADSRVRPGVDGFDMLKDTLLIRLRDAFGKYR